jgi:hypothetical protein
VDIGEDELVPLDAGLYSRRGRGRHGARPPSPAPGAVRARTVKNVDSAAGDWRLQVVDVTPMSRRCCTQGPLRAPLRAPAVYSE